MDTQVHTKRVSPRDVFNLPLSKYFLLLDCRGNAEFRDHVGLAFSFPPLPEGLTYAEQLRQVHLFLLSSTNLQVVSSFVQDYGCPDYMSPVVVYGDQQNLAHVEQLASFLLEWISSPTSYPSGEFGTEQFLSKLKTETKEIWILDGGIEAMRQCYPLVIGPDNKPPSTPLHVQDNLFLGRSCFKLSESNLSGLGIAHVITRGDIRKHVNGVTYHTNNMDECDLEQLDGLWDVTNSLISSCTGNVLVQLNGKSASLTGYDNLSASVVLVFCVEVLGVPVEEVMAFLGRSCIRFSWEEEYLAKIQYRVRNSKPCLC